MSDPAADLIARALAARERWVAVEGGAELCVRRPPEAEMGALRGGLQPERVAGFVVGWRGVTLGMVLGAAAQEGERDRAAPYSPGLAQATLLDRAAWLNAVADAVVDMVQQHLQERDDAAKN